MPFGAGRPRWEPRSRCSSGSAVNVPLTTSTRVRPRVPTSPARHAFSFKRRRGPMLILDPITGTRFVVRASLESNLVPHQGRIISGSRVIDHSELRATNDAHSDHWSEY